MGEVFGRKQAKGLNEWSLNSIHVSSWNNQLYENHFPLACSPQHKFVGGLMEILFFLEPLHRNMYIPMGVEKLQILLFLMTCLQPMFLHGGFVSHSVFKKLFSENPGAFQAIETLSRACETFDGSEQNTLRVLALSGAVRKKLEKNSCLHKL